jgi:hypothetical protein
VVGDRQERLERLGRFYASRRYAVAWTAGNTGDDAKAVRAAGWDRTEPLKDVEFAAGLFATRGRTRNPAIVARPSGLVLVECDSADDIARFQELVPIGTLTVQSSSPTRRHFYYAAPAEGLRFSSFRFETGRVTGYGNAYLVAPPAIHPSGAEYRFLSEHGSNTAELPRDLYDKLAALARQHSQTGAELHDPDAKVPHGGRHTHFHKLASSMRARGVPLDGALVACTRTNEERCEPPLDAGELEQLVRDVYSRYPAATALSGSILDSPFDYDPDFDVGQAGPNRGRRIELNDLGFAREFIASYGTRFRHVNETEQWIYCRGGRWYEHTARKQARQAMIRVLHDLPRSVAHLDLDDPVRQAVLKYAAKAPTSAKVAAALTVAEAEPEMMISNRVLDQRPRLLACRNGTFDFETGRLRDHDPRDFLTRGSPLSYEPGAKALRWERFLREVFLDDDGLIAYVQRMCGYCLTGEIREELFWCFSAPAATAKASSPASGDTSSATTSTVPPTSAPSPTKRPRRSRPTSPASTGHGSSSRSRRAAPAPSTSR